MLLAWTDDCQTASLPNSPHAWPSTAPAGPSVHGPYYGFSRGILRTGCPPYPPSSALHPLFPPPASWRHSSTANTTTGQKKRKHKIKKVLFPAIPANRHCQCKIENQKILCLATTVTCQVQRNNSYNEKQLRNAYHTAA